LCAEDVADNSIVEVWPESVLPLEILFAMQTQWVVGPAGPIGLNYVSLPVVYEAHRVKRKQIPELFKSLCIMEAEALRSMSK
jgi:hypothetical protein